MMGRPHARILPKLAIGAAAAQVGLLGFWATANPWPWASTLAAATAVAWAIGPPRALSQSTATLARLWHSTALQELALGGLGMLLGAWVDAGFGVPPCLCCRWKPGTPMWAMWADGLASWSALGMALGCAVAVLAPAWAAPGGPTARMARRCAIHLVGMQLGMAVSMGPTSAALRRLPWGKLELGHAGMLLGMGLGALVCSKAVKACSRARV